MSTNYARRFVRAHKEPPGVPFVALDVGERRIGVAVSDPSETLALPHCVIERTNVRVDVARIATIAAEYPNAELVVGYPLTLAGERGPAAQKMDAFLAHLRRGFAGAIHLCDERMTTAMATRSLIAADVSRKRRKAVIDQVAAANILETFLMKQRREKSAP